MSYPARSAVASRQREQDERKNGTAIAVHSCTSAAARVMAEPTNSSPSAASNTLSPSLFLAARALVVQSTKTGKRDRQAFNELADFSDPLFGGTAMVFTDRILTCIDCGAEFVFTAGEQVFFKDKQFRNDPKRCKQCKAKRSSSGTRVRAETRTTCSECGDETTVPFKPTQGRPVLCRSCFQKRPPASASPSSTLS
jgi:CxxC-x17-CxxC domain-containing protein